MAKSSSYDNAIAGKAEVSFLRDIFSYQYTEEGHIRFRGGKGVYSQFLPAIFPLSFAPVSNYMPCFITRIARNMTSLIPNCANLPLCWSLNHQVCNTVVPCPR